MAKWNWTLLTLIGLYSCSSQLTPPEKTWQGKQLKLVWAEEFDYEGLPDPAKWSYDVGNTCDQPMGCGWGNNELQFYTENRLENARVEGGHLVIEARPEKMDRNNFTSARIKTKGKGDWTYGFIEIRAKPAPGVGAWSAIWMLPTDKVYGGWPKSGEIDIMEHVGYEADTIYGTVHTESYNGMIGNQESGIITKADTETAFHTYAVHWQEDQIQFIVDDEVFHVHKNDGSGTAYWPFDQAFHLIMNIAVGGNWGGEQGVDKEAFPAKMEVDYVRVYQ